MLLKKRYSGKERIVCIVISGLFWYLFAHGYRMSNNIFSHDALLQIIGDDSAWQIALGRFMQPALLLIRGGISNPWLISVIAIIEILVASFFLTDILKIENCLGIFLCLGVMVCNPVLVAANASFVPWLDFYTLALLTSVLGVWLWERKSFWNRIAAIVCMVISMGIYQAYISVCIGLFIILLIEKLSQECKKSDFAKEAMLKCGGLIASAGLYYLLWTAIRRIFNIWEANTYNGLSGVLSFENSSLWALIANTYLGVLDFFWNPDVFFTLVFRGRSLGFLWLRVLRLANILAFFAIVYGVVCKWKNRKNYLWGKIIQAALIIILPLGVNFVSFLSKGMVHSLMIYAYLLIYIFALKQINREELHIKVAIQYIVSISVLVCIWANVVWGNQVYLKLSLQDQANSSFITMLVYDIETTEGFKPQTTQVALAGTIEQSPYIQELSGFESIYCYGMRKTTTTYMGTEAAYIRYQINAPFEISYVPIDDKIKSMPIYPEKGSIGFIDGVLVVHISE